MAKVQIKSEKLTPFGGIFSIMEQFDSMLSSVIDSILGRRCRTSIGYQYSEIIRSLMSVYFYGGSCVEDVTFHLMPHLSLHPSLRTCSSDTILRAIKELTTENLTYTSKTGKSYDFNAADTLNRLLLHTLQSMGALKKGKVYDVDFDHQFIETEKYDAQMTYKHFLGYRAGVAVIGDWIIGGKFYQSYIFWLLIFSLRIQRSNLKSIVADLRYYRNLIILGIPGCYFTSY